eukprot:6154077-Prorocentrum_lima.AAC.1
MLPTPWATSSLPHGCPPVPRRKGAGFPSSSPPESANLSPQASAEETPVHQVGSPTFGPPATSVH